MEVPGSAEVAIEEPSSYNCICRNRGYQKLAVSSFEVPALLGNFGVAGAAKDGLIGGSLDLWTVRAAHAARFNVMDLQVPGGATDLAAGISGDEHIAIRKHVVNTSSTRL